MAARISPNVNILTRDKKKRVRLPPILGKFGEDGRDLRSKLGGMDFGQ